MTTTDTTAPPGTRPSPSSLRLLPGNGDGVAPVELRVGGRAALAPVVGPAHEPYRATLRRFVDDWRARSWSWERDGGLPPDVLPALGDAGAFRSRWRDGAMGGLPWSIVMAEELGALSSGVALAAMTHSEVFLGALHRLARTPGQQALREAALDGRVVGAFAATEPGSGSDLAALATTAEPVSEGWRMRGRKRYISNLDAASHILVLARIGGTGGFGLFVVPVDAPGVEVCGYYAKAGTRSCATGEAAFDTDLTADALLGAAGSGLAYASWLLQLERVSICAQMLALSHSSLGLAVAYARGRHVGGDRLIGKQAVRHRLAATTVRVWAAESLFHAVVASAMGGGDVSHATVAAKLACTEAAAQAVDDSLQVLGGRGYTSNFPVEQWWRDARAARIGGGSDEVLRDLIASAVDRPHPRFDAWVDALLAEDGPRPHPYAGPAPEEIDTHG